MSDTLIVIFFAIGLVAFFALGMSLTLIIKGHNIKSEISENEHMKARGITCVIQDSGIANPTTDCLDSACSSAGCSSCNAGIQK